MGYSKIGVLGQIQGHVTLAFMCFLKKKKTRIKIYLSNTNCLTTYCKLVVLSTV